MLKYICCCRYYVTKQTTECVCWGVGGGGGGGGVGGDTNLRVSNQSRVGDSMIFLLNSFPIRSVNHKHRQKRSLYVLKYVFLRIVWFYCNYGHLLT